MMRHPALSALIFGAIAATGFAPLQLWPATLIGLAGFASLIHDAPRLKTALWRGWLFGLGHFTVNSNWIQHAFDFQSAMPPVLGYVACVALALYLAVFPMLAAGIAWRLGRRDDGAPDAAFALVLAAAWIGTEWLRSVLFTGYAWDPIGVVWLPVQAFAGIAAWVGTYALSGLTVAMAALMLVMARRRWWLALPVIAVPAVLQPLSYLRQAEPSAVATPRVRVVQPDIGQEDRSEDDGPRVLDALIKRSGSPGPAPRLVVWPEGVVRDYVEDGYPRWIYGLHSARSVRAQIASVLGPRDIALVGGTALAFDRDDTITSAANSVFAIDAAGQIVGRYDKAHLVPYGEYLPLRWLLEPIGLSRLVPGDIDFVDGPGPANLTLPAFGAVGIQICYEIIFSGRTVDPAHRPRLLFNPSNDAWFGTWGPPQHLAQARMRAIEEGLPIVRATPTGISAIIAADGRLLATVPHETAGAIELPIPPALPPTLFSRVGNLMAALVALLFVGLAVALRHRNR